jgi:hypothetical protein
VSIIADRLCAEYRQELARLYGADRAEKSRVDYHGGWYYISTARRWPDGSVGTLGRTSAYREKQVREMLATLQSQTPLAEESK